ncbi:MAG: hypothetical protein KZQ70_05285 [gamma proteobacterium symbiont of Lucinoma myriamae]|nr:hypothetical protein [gamma proteobacterium symbiont of Lucinoma myriamae]MCU7819404.1 hypothetical protein [gamma proteobacterium symbiont of Lucinoma myriamae]MCU7831954.1 hypothetical protein [gamma proteobacterium symbiont of Lucinoma myriamae]
MILKKQLLLFLLIMTFVLSSSLSQAEAEEDYTEMSPQELMSLEIFTAASMLPTELKKAPGTVYSFNRSDFERLGVRRIDEL